MQEKIAILKLTKLDVISAEKERILIDNVDSFDWEEFSITLLDYIHRVIYNRKESMSAKIFKD